MKFLFKFPSRGRPDKFKSTLLKHLENLSKKNEYKFIFRFDVDDLTMNNKEINDFLSGLNIEYQVFYGLSENKIEAINSNITTNDFDVLILVADDMIPIINNYDELISDILDENKTLDTIIHFNTLRWADLLDVWCIMGRTYYERFNYIYHPDYKSIYSDNEYTEVAKILKKYIFSEKIPFFHDHVTGDSTESLNNKFYNEDYRTYLYRKENNFFLNE